jgi:hypothetical protein
MEVRKSMYNWGLCTFIISFTDFDFNESPFNPCYRYLLDLQPKTRQK